MKGRYILAFYLLAKNNIKKIVLVIIFVFRLANAGLIFCKEGENHMSAEVAAAKAVVAVASDKRGRIAIATILCSVIMLFFLPLIAYMGVMSNIGEIEVDTAQAQQMIVQNMSAEEKAKLSHLESVMTGIGKEFQKRKLNNLTIKKAQALYACALYNVEKTDPDFITKYADCFERAKNDDDLRNAVFSAFGVAIDKDEFNNLMSVIKNTVIDIDLTDTDKNNLDLVRWAEFAYENKWGYVWGSHGQLLTEKELNRLKGVFGSHVTDKEAYIREHTQSDVLLPSQDTLRRKLNGRPSVAITITVRGNARSAARSIGLRIANRRFAPRNVGRKSITW